LLPLKKNVPLTQDSQNKMIITYFRIDIIH